MKPSWISFDRSTSAASPRFRSPGGEPLIRRGFEEIVRELTKRKIRITQIYSNGFLVNDKLLDMLEAAVQVRFVLAETT